MVDEENPDPEILLSTITREESQRLKGKLKIFLGMAAGVGKTFEMLSAAQDLKKEGVDVVVGVIATHGRQDTANLLKGLELIPQKNIHYKDAVFEEFDIDLTLQRKPQLVLIDELAHSNVPGSRHPKRWQDVMEVLDHGIDVYTTLNVQHIESLKDVVENITGITIRESVPDLVIEKSASIELIDITPMELLRRLKEGKVYLGDQSVIAARNFFQEDRLTALREIVLRYAANKVDHELKGMTSTALHSDGWKPRERLLVAVSHSPHSQKLIRITRRLAFNLDAPWIAVHVDDGRVLDDQEQETLDKNLALARDLGAEVITTTDSSLSHAIQRVARQRNATQIIIGRPPRRFLVDLFRRNTLMDHLARECSDIDLHVIRQALYSNLPFKKWKFPSFSNDLISYGLVSLAVLLLTLFNWLICPLIGYKLVGSVFLLGTLSLCIFFSSGPVIFAAVVYTLIWFLVFAPQRPQGGYFGEDIFRVVLYFIAITSAALISDRSRKYREIVTRRERTVEALYEIVQEIASLPTFDQVLSSVKERLSSVLHGKCEIIVKSPEGSLVFQDIPLFQDEKEKAAATWVFQNGKEAGWSTSTLPMVKSLYIPLKSANNVVGVLAFDPKTDKRFSVEEKNFLYTVGHQLASYLERTYTEAKMRKHEEDEQIKLVYQSIFNLIQNLFEGPLVSIQDSMKEIEKEGTVKLTPFLEKVKMSTESLFHILGNISAMVKLHSGATPINLKMNSIEVLVKSCYERISKLETNYKWEIEFDENIHEIQFDYELIELLFYNLIFHAMEFSLPGSVIKVETRHSGDYVMLSVESEGQNIPVEMFEVTFEKMYRLPYTSASGLGMGLAVAKLIAEIHKGQLRVQNREEGGMVFIFFLPIDL